MSPHRKEARMRRWWETAVCVGILSLCGLAGCETSGPKQDGEEQAVRLAPPLPGSSSQADARPSPDTFQVEFETTKGNFVIEVQRRWSPNGAGRFYELVQSGYYNGCKFFRAVPGFMVQFGISGDPALNTKWRETPIPDDPVQESNQPGFVTFAKSALPNSRTTQIFINYGDNSRLDSDGFAPFGKVISGMDVVNSLEQSYGEEPSRFQQQIQEQGNAFLESQFPKLDAIIAATVISPASEPANADAAQQP
jgi:peptidyl-prolyl cis-trans isomerase A (cyclophilin A)